MKEERYARLHHRDSESDLDPTHYRMYSSDTGRWMTPDPASEASANPLAPQSFDRYGYASGNPSTMVDPWGLFQYSGITDQFPGATNFGQTELCINSGYACGYNGTPSSFYAYSTNVYVPSYSGPGVVPPSPPPPPQPTAQQQFNNCVAQAKAVENYQVREATAATAVGGIAILGAFALYPYLAGEGVFEGIEGAGNIFHIAEAFVPGPVLYYQGIMSITAALNQYDASVAQCQDRFGVYP